MLERDFQRQLKSFLEKHECVVYKTAAGTMVGVYGNRYAVASGYPDLMVFNYGTCVLIELKTDSKTSKLRQSQVRRFKELNSVGMTVYVARPQDYDLFKETMNESDNDLQYSASHCFANWRQDAKEFGIDEPKRKG